MPPLLCKLTTVVLGIKKNLRTEPPWLDPQGDFVAFAVRPHARTASID